MLKSALLKKTICMTTIFSFAFANLPGSASAYSYRLTPESFEEMYSLAQRGRVEALRASVNRGLNIDAMNADGDTGLCVAAHRRDSYTYNAFRAAGANPHHPCTQNIDNYSGFIASSNAVSEDSTPRAAYGAIGKEKYSVSPSIWWWIGGAALIGGIIALILGHGGHGGSSSSDDPTEDYNSLGSTAGKKGTIKYSADGKSSENSLFMNVINSKTAEIAKIAINSSVLSYTDYLDVALYAINGGGYTNTKDTVLQIGEGVVGMVATKNSFVNNFGFINVDSYNASVGMVASEESTAINQGRGIVSGESNNGIALNLSGNDDSNTLIGMYADTKSTIKNYGDIKGTAIEAVEVDSSSQTTDYTGLINPDAGEAEAGAETGTGASAANGTLVGMEAMIVNAGKDLNKDTIKMINETSGKINLSAGDAGASDKDIKVSLVGMGSFLDYGFMNGSKNINRAEKVEMYNYGDITVGYTGNYVASSDKSLRKGTGGLIGMRVDANASAYNLNNISLNLEEYSSGSSNVDVSAGMQSVHGGNLFNTGTISITTSAGNQRKSYGMLSVEGSGSVSGLYTDLNQNLNNSGYISVQASNSFGIASFNGGNLNNSGNITLGKVETTTLYEKNIAMYAYGKTKEASIENTGTIDIYSHDSIAMQNDFAGGTAIYNKGIVNVHESATNSYVFGGAYSEAHNSNLINYEANSTGETSTDGIKYDPFANYSLSIGNSIISTQSRSVLGESPVTSSSTTEKIYNDENSTINMNGSSYVSALSVEADSSGETQGKAFNNGEINISDSLYSNATNTVGMYLGNGSLNNAYIINNNNITTDSRFSAAMASESSKNASMINNGTITASKKYSLGLYANGITNIMNNKNIAMNGDDNVGIYSSGSAGKSLISNSSEAKIVIGGKNAETENSYGIYIASGAKATVENGGLIDTYTKEAGAGIYSKGSDVTIENAGTINANGNDAFGIYASGKADITNAQNAVINVGSSGNKVDNSYGIYNEAEGEISNKGTINLYNSEESEAFAIYSKGNSEVTNEGTINLNGENSTAIYAENGKIINKNTINIDYDNVNGLKSSKSAEVLNDTNGIINVGKVSKSVSNSNGMIHVASSEGTSDEGLLTNKGTINLYSTENGNSHAVSIEAKATFNNDNVIRSYNGYSSAVYITAEAYVTNSGEITVEGSNTYGIRSIATSSGNQNLSGYIIGYGGDDLDNPTGSLTFRNSGRIIVGNSSFLGDSSYGVYAKEIDSLINNGVFIIYNSSSYAIYAEEGNSIENNNSITLNGSNSTAIFGGNTSTVTNRGQIISNKAAGKGIYTTGKGTINNNNTITLIDGNGSYGIYATGAATINNSQDGIITVGQNSVAATNGYGIYAPEASSITNEAMVYIHANGTAITGGDSIINRGNLTIAQNNSRGISSNGSDVENSGVIRILTSGNNFGIYASDAVNIVNDSTGTITLGTELNSAGNDFGIYALNANNIENYASIAIYTSGAAITGGNNIINTAGLRLYQEGSKGIVSNGTSVQNSGIIELSLPTGSYGILSTGDAVISNEGTGLIIIGNSSTISSIGAYGIYASNASRITNAASINVYATSSYGIEGGYSSVIENNGNINLYNSDNIGISSSGSSSITNTKNINITGANNSYGIKAATSAITNAEGATIILGASNVTGGIKNYGIFSLDGTVDNNGSIYIYGSGYGIYGQYATSITNSGTLMIKDTGSTGIYTALADVTNSGVINMLGDTATGIYSDGDGTINNTGTASIKIVSGSAIYATRNTPVINNGIISVTSSGYGVNNALYVNNGGSISIGSGTAVYSKGSVTNSGTINVKDTGTAVQGSSLNNSGDIEVNNTLSTAAVNISGAVTNTGNIVVSGTGNAIESATSLTNSNSVIVNDGTAVTNVRNVNNSGTIKTLSGTAIDGASVITNSGGQIIGTTYAVNGGSELINEAGGTISISSGTAAVNGVSDVTNAGKIEVTGTATAAIYGATNVDNSGSIVIYKGHGIYTKNPGNINNSGSITVKSGNGNGIYVVVPTVTSTVTITNTGTISVASGYAIYVEKNYTLNTHEIVEAERTGIEYTDNTTIEPGSVSVTYGGTCGQHCQNGEIVWYPNPTTTSSLISVSDVSLLSNIRLLNLGQISVSGDVDFGSVEDETASASIGKNGSYEADTFSGTVLADSSLVEGGFETVYVNEDAFVGADNGLNIMSQSYLFDASLMSNDNGNINVVMTMSSFEDKVDNSRIAEFLSKNYQAQKGEGVFDILKSANDKAQFDDYLNKELGFNIIPNLAKQSLDIEKTINTELNDDLMTKTTETNRYKANILTYRNDVDAYHEISGYKDNIVAAYGYGDKSVSKNWRVGLALTAVRSDSKFDDDSTRYNNMMELSTPIIFAKNDLSAMFKPKAGFARGHYRRNAVDKAYKASTKEYYYGFDSGIRQSIDTGFVAVEPQAGFNLTGLYSDDIKENNDGLKIKSNNTLSSLAYLGLDIKKKFIFNKNNALSLSLGGKYFRELGDRYDARTTVSNMLGSYNLTDNRMQRNYGLLNLKAIYNLGQFSMAASANVPLEQKHNPYYLFNLGYDF